ncbi:MAG TPA: YfhO family protein, partial [Candidatus Omnitrophota bacterium]|nr:YfhO family protein [Candidatus Omnitrophota bacterium]
QYWTVNVDLLLPLILIAMDRLIRHPQTKNMVFMTIAVALTIFAGHPEHIFLVNAYALAFFIYRSFSLRKSGNWKKSAKLALAAYGLAFGLGAIVLFPFLQNFLFEAWHNHPPGTGLMMEEQRDRALTLALPHFFQTVNLTYQWSFAGWWGGYLGTIPLALAAMSLFSNQRRGLNYFFAAMTFILVAKEYGLPVINWLGYLPLFNACRYAIHTPHLVAFSVAVLSGMGLRAITAPARQFGKGLSYCIILMIIIYLHFFFLKKTLDQSLAVKASLFAVVLLIIFQMILFLKDRGILKKQTVAILLAVLVFGELFLYIHRERPHRFNSFPKVPYIEFLRSQPEQIRSYGIFWAFYPNTATGFAVDDLGYFFSLAPKRFVSFVNTLLIPNHFRNDFRPPALRAIPIEGKRHLLDLLNLKYIIVPEKGWLSKMLPVLNRTAPEGEPVYSKEVNILQREGYFPRAYVVHKVIPMTDEAKSLMLIDRLGDQLRQVAVINDRVSGSISLDLRDAPMSDNSTAQISKYTANEVIVKAKLENPGFLILGDAYHPDWKAYVDGSLTKIYQTDYLLRSVFLPAGEHTVKFVFVPKWFYIGGLVSLLALIALIIAWNLPSFLISKSHS